jgi:hypothetical protein
VRTSPKNKQNEINSSIENIPHTLQYSGDLYSSHHFPITSGAGVGSFSVHIPAAAL